MCEHSWMEDEASPSGWRCEHCNRTMPTWQDTFERFHDICNTIEANGWWGYTIPMHYVAGVERPTMTRPADRSDSKLDADALRNGRCWVLPQVDSNGQTVEPGVAQPGNAPFTPSTDQVRAAYVRAMRNAFIASAGEHEMEFDRWLAIVLDTSIPVELKQAAQTKAANEQPPRTLTDIVVQGLEQYVEDDE